MKPRVLLSEDINPLGKELFAGKADLIIASDTTKETTIDLVKDVEGIILRATTKIDAEVMSHASKLKVIARTGVGVDNVDVEEATSRGILVCNFPGMNDLTVAEHTVSRIMALSKRVLDMHQAVLENNWGERFSPDLIEAEGRKLGIIGMGRIGKLVAKKCKEGLGMEILVFDPFVTEQESAGFHLVKSLEDLFLESDFITLHVPNIPSTRGLVSKELLEMMKSTSFLVNTSRGEVIDEQALVEVLKSKKIKGAALDVFMKEPLSLESPLRELDNVILSPHCAGSTWESNVRIATGAAQAVIDVLEGRMPERKYIYNAG